MLPVECTSRHVRDYIVSTLPSYGQVRLTVSRPGYTPRPAGVGIRESHSSELVLVATTYTV
jgi:hypothetical protein